MSPKPNIDTFGATALIAFSLLLALNQVVVKLTNEGLQPVFFAGVRSAGAIFCIGAWIWFRGVDLKVPRRLWPLTCLIGLVFTAEFMFLFIALDLTSVSRASIIFYSMPVWLTLSGHFVFPSETMSRSKFVGLVFAFSGVCWAILGRPAASLSGSVWGDLFALGASLCWAAIALIARGTEFREIPPIAQMFYQVLISAIVLLAMAPAFGPLVREFEPIHSIYLVFQIVVVISFGFVFWLWLLTQYPTSSVASFAFLAPVLSVALGWLLLGETIGLSILVALALVAIGLLLINRPVQVPQKV